MRAYYEPSSRNLQAEHAFIHGLDVYLGFVAHPAGDLMSNRFTLTLLCAGLLLVSPTLAQDQPKPEADKPEADKPEADKPGDKPGADKPGDKKETKDERRKRRQAERRARLRAKNPNNPKLRDLAPDTPEAQALSEILAVESNYAKDGTVMLVYTFRAPEHIGDWKRNGFDLADQVAGKGRRRGRRARAARRNGKTNRLALGVSSRKKGLFLHRLALTEEWTVTVDLVIDRMTSRSDFVVFCGKGGLRWGNQFVQRSKTRFKRLTKDKLNKTAFDKGRQVSIKLEAKENVLTAWVNGTKVGSTKKLKNKLDGVVGIFATDMLLFVNKIEIKGKVEKSKL